MSLMTGNLLLAAMLPESWGKGARLEVKPAALCGQEPRRSIAIASPTEGDRQGVPAWKRTLGLGREGDQKLQFFLGVQDGGAAGAPCEFQVVVNGRVLWEKSYAAAEWEPVEIDLSSYAGNLIFLEFAVKVPEGATALLGEPRILEGGRLLYDLADLLEGSSWFLLREESAADRRARLQVVPGAEILAWQRLEMICFTHFGINTFSNREWGTGSEPAALFNPADFDARQWARAVKDAGLKMIILTAKHHDGFCLWPSRYTDYSVKNSPWRNGRGDIVREVAEACREYGLKFGFYLSPWDRNNPLYGSGEAYDEYFMNQLTELLTDYGEVTEVWFDGANGEGPNGKKQQYDWERYFGLVRRLQPQALMAICGPDIRWVGNESGMAAETEWSVQKIDGEWKWYPAECDVSIRPGWFYHPDEKPKTAEQLVDIYFQSVGRNSVLLLNIPPDTRGRFADADVAALRGFRAELDKLFQTDLAERAVVPAENGPARPVPSGDEESWWCPQGEGPYTLELQWKEPVEINIVELAEAIRHGQRVEAFRLFYRRTDGSFTPWLEGTTIGYRRLLRASEPVKTDAVRILIEQSLAAPLISSVKVY